jgi:hypothetical protein
VGAQGEPGRAPPWVAPHNPKVDYSFWLAGGSGLPPPSATPALPPTALPPTALPRRGCCERMHAATSAVDVACHSVGHSHSHWGATARTHGDGAACPPALRRRGHPRFHPALRAQGGARDWVAVDGGCTHSHPLSGGCGDGARCWRAPRMCGGCCAARPPPPTPGATCLPARRCRARRTTAPPAIYGSSAGP